MAGWNFIEASADSAVLMSRTNKEFKGERQDRSLLKDFSGMAQGHLYHILVKKKKRYF